MGAHHADAIAVAAAAFRASKAKEAAHIAALDKERAEQRCLIADEEKRARLIELEDDDAALRHLDGDDAAPSKPARLKSIAALTAKIPQRKAALPILRQRAAEAARDAEAARTPLNAAILEAVSLIQAPAAEKIRTLLTELEGPLIDLVTADRIRAGTIGDRYSVPAGQKPPFNGEMIVRKLLSSISPHLLPRQIDFDRIEARARAAATAAIGLIKENRS